MRLPAVFHHPERVLDNEALWILSVTAVLLAADMLVIALLFR